MADGNRLGVRLLGELALFDGLRELPLPASRKTRALFVYLLLNDRAVRRERLCELFFDIPDDPRAALRWSLTKIRTMLGPFADLLDADRDRVRLDATGVSFDIDRLRGAAAAHADDADLRAAAALALEQPLAGLELPSLDGYELWLAAQRAEIDRLRARTLARAALLPDLTPERRELYAAEAEAIGLDDAEPATPAAPLAQEIRYCVAPDGTRIAYATTGDGPPLVKAANWLNHLELDWTGPVWGRLFEGLSERHRLIRYDERGNGLSEWNVAELSFAAFVSDLETVVDALGLERFPLLGISQGCAVCIEYAARHPERVSQLVLLGGYAAGWEHVAGEDERAQREAVITLAEHGWGEDNPIYRQLFSQTFMPSATPEEIAWFNDFQKRTASPENAVRFMRTFAAIDVRDRLEAIRCPTLILHARGDQRVALAEATYIAGRIPDASLVTVETDNHIPLSREPAMEQIIECVHAFLA